MSIRYKILIGAMAIILVVSGGTALALISLMKHIGEGEALLSLKTAANTYVRFNQQQRNLALMKAKILADTPVLKATISIPGVDPDTVAYSLSQLDLIDSDSSVLVFGPERRLLGATGGLKEIINNGYDLPGLGSALEGEDFYGAASIEGQYYQVAAVPSISGDVLAGILVLALPLDFVESVKAFRYTTGTALALVFSDKITTSQGTALLSQSNSLAASLLSSEGKLVAADHTFPIFEKETNSGKHYTIAIPLGKEQDRALLYRSTDLVPSTLLKVRWIIIGYSILGVLLGAAFTFWVSGRISRAIIDLAESATKLGEGDLSARATPQSNDELGSLAQSFNRMADHVVEKQTALLASKEEAEAANRAKSTFLATMSHEIRTPLNGVLGMAEVVSRSINDPGQRRNLEVIHQSGNHLLEVIDDILDFSKIEAGHFELSYSDVQLSEFMHDLYKIHKPFATRKGIELILALPSDFEGKVEFDQVRLRRVLTNLIHNALKFTEQGQVNITVTATERSSDSTRLSFEVSDTGIGIEAGQLDSVFKPFKQADGSATRKHGGAGLGLAISRQLIGLMGGDLEVSSEPGIGSRFSFAIECKALNSNASPETLPRQSLSRPAIPLEVEPQGFGNQSDEHRRLVLVVEDSLPNQEVARAMLEWLGCEVVVAENGLIALDAVRKREFDLILMDCQMPEMGGLEATRRMRMKQQTEGTRHIPIVALTANAVLGDREECERAGMDDYIAKPFELKDLEDALAKWCTKRTDAITNREEKHDLQ